MIKFLGIALVALSLFSTAPTFAQEQISAKCKAVFKQHKVEKCGRNNPACIAENAKKRDARLAAGCPAGKVKQ